MYIYIYMYVYICMCIYVYTYICVHVNAFIFFYLYVHTYYQGGARGGRGERRGWRPERRARRPPRQVWEDVLPTPRFGLQTTYPDLIPPSTSKHRTVGFYRRQCGSVEGSAGIRL